MMDAITTQTRRHRAALARLALPRFAARAAGRPVVVAVEGPNGAGKSTLCRALARRLGAPCRLGVDADWFAPPFKVRMIRDAAWYASAMFFLSGCCEQMRRIDAGGDALVILDRSLWSTLAVHAAESVERLAAVLALLRPIAAEVRVPDFTLVLSASFATCQARIARKTGAARLLDDLTADAAFHAREQAFYRWLARRLPAGRAAFLDVDDARPARAAERAAALIRDGLSKPDAR